MQSTVNIHKFTSKQVQVWLDFTSELKPRKKIIHQNNLLWVLKHENMEKNQSVQTHYVQPNNFVFTKEKLWNCCFYNTLYCPVINGMGQLIIGWNLIKLQPEIRLAQLSTELFITIFSILPVQFLGKEELGLIMFNCQMDLGIISNVTHIAVLRTNILV